MLLAFALARRRAFGGSLFAVALRMYGALSDDCGRVELGWSLEPDESGGETFTISWRERGGPAVTAPSRAGFGSTVICQVAKESLGAKVELNYASTGLVWRLQCPAREIMASVSFV